VRPLVKRLREIYQALNRLREEFDLPGELQNEVTALIAWLHYFEFVVSATFWFKALQAINEINCLLQSPKITLDEEIKLLKSLLKTLQHLQESWPLVFQKAKSVASTLGLKRNLNKRVLLEKAAALHMSMRMR